MFENRMDQWIDRYCKQFPFSGSVCVISKNKVIYRRNVGLENCELNVPIDNHTRFRLYSMTKAFTALGLLRLYEKQKIALEDHPGKYLAQAASLHSDITIKHLLDHTHGLPDITDASDYGMFGKGYGKSFSQTEDILERIKEMPMDFAPGTSCRYTNIGFFIISMIIEAVTGMEWSDYMQREVFEPLGMKDACIDSEYKLIQNRASGYDIDGGNIIAAPYLCIDNLRGGGDAVGTIEDVSCLYRAIRNKSYLKPETWDMVFSVNKDNFGLGCRVFQWLDNKTCYMHTGGHLGFRTLHMHLPEDDFSIILLSNMGFGNARSAFADTIYYLYFGTADGKKELVEMDKGFARNSQFVYPLLAPQRSDAYKCALNTFVGKYQKGNKYILMDIEEIDGVEGLKITYPDKRTLSIYPIAQGEFFNRFIDESYKITKNTRGKYSFEGMEKI